MSKTEKMHLNCIDYNNVFFFNGFAKIFLIIKNEH